MRKGTNSPWVASQAAPLFIVVSSTHHFLLQSGLGRGLNFEMGACKTEGKSLSLETGNTI